MSTLEHSSLRDHDSPKTTCQLCEEEILGFEFTAKEVLSPVHTVVTNDGDQKWKEIIERMGLELNNFSDSQSSLLKGVLGNIISQMR